MGIKQTTLKSYFFLTLKGASLRCLMFATFATCLVRRAPHLPGAWILMEIWQEPGNKGMNDTMIQSDRNNSRTDTSYVSTTSELLNK